MRNPYHKSMHRSRVIPVFECIVPTFCQILKIAKALDFTAFQRFSRPIGRTIAKPDTLAVSGFAIHVIRCGENSRCISVFRHTL